MTGWSAASRTPAQALPFHASSTPVSPQLWMAVRSFPAIAFEIEGEDAVCARRASQHLRMAQRAQGVMVACTPVILHRQTRELVVLGMPLVVLRPVDQVDDVVDLLTRHRLQDLQVLGLIDIVGKRAHQGGKRTLNPVHVLELISARPGSAGKLNLFLTGRDFGDVSRKLAARAPEIDLKCQRILPAGTALNHPLQRRIGHKAAVPVVLAIDLDGGKARRQRPACHDVFRPDRMRLAVEIDKVAGPDIDGAGAETCDPGVEPVKIHQPRREESRRSEAGGRGCAHSVEEIACVVTARDIKQGIAGPVPGPRRGHLRPKLTQSINARLRRVARDDRAVDRSDRNAGHPIRMNAGFRKGLIDAALVCTQGTATLQEQRDAVKRRPSVNRSKLVWSKLESHGFSCASFGWPGGRQRIETGPPLNKLYGVVYKHRSPDLSSLPVHN